MRPGPRSAPASSEHSALPRAAEGPVGPLRLLSDDGSTDRQLADRIRSGDVDAFERVFRGYFAALCAVVNGYVRSPDVAEELVQDLMLAIWNQRARLEVRESLRVYLFRAARNRALNSVRHTRREIAWTLAAGGSQPASPAPLPAAHDVLESRELETAVGAAIAALPERRRLAFQLTQQAGLSHAETAAVMGIAPKTVAIHLGLARHELRSRLEAFLDR
jgi:RNA polymerase sigma-70 factor, ECF subfamily